MAIKPNKISLIDYKTKVLVKTQRMTDLKSWFSGDGYYNLTPVFLQNPTSPLGDNTNPGAQPTFSSTLNQTSSNLLASLFRFNSNSLDVNKLFVIEFRSCKWHLQIDDFHSLKSITCILLDQSLDMGIDSNPLMLDLTISEHFQNRYKLFSPDYQNNYNRNSVRNHHYQSHVSTLYGKKRHNTTTSSRGGINNMPDKKSAISNNSNSQNSKSVNDKGRNDPGASPSVSIVVNQRNHSMILDPDQNSDMINLNQNGHGSNANGSFSVIGCDRPFKNTQPMASIFSANGLGYGYGQINSPSKSAAAYKYELEFQELQLILLWFPEEVAIRLTQVEYELFRQVPPTEYLRHATLDMNNFKSSLVADAAAKAISSKNSNSDSGSATVSNVNFTLNGVNVNNIPSKSVQDLIVRYKEVFY